MQFGKLPRTSSLNLSAATRRLKLDTAQWYLLHHKALAPVHVHAQDFNFTNSSHYVFVKEFESNERLAARSMAGIQCARVVTAYGVDFQK